MILSKGIVVMLLVITRIGAFAEESPKDQSRRAASVPATCWLLGEGGDTQTLSIRYEYSWSFLEHHFPEGEGPDFRWSDLPPNVKVESRTLVRRNKRDYLEICYQSPPLQGMHQSHRDMVLAYRTSEGWIRPIFVAHADYESYNSRLISNEKYPLALSVVIGPLGHDQLTSYFLFDLWKTPRFVTGALSHRVKRGAYSSDAEYEKEINRMGEETRLAQGD
jgi:hypothetical protein